MKAEDLLAGAVPVVAMEYGSQVYGTSLPSSDRDIKGVFLPPGRSILLQQVQDALEHSTKPDAARANTAQDVDSEYFSLQRYLGLLLEGQTNAIDMLFTPERFYIGKPHEAWNEIRRNKGHFLHSGVSAFARYCRQQAAKYGIKGSRIAALRAILSFLGPLDGNEKLSDLSGPLESFLRTEISKTGEAVARHMRLLEIEETPQKRTGRYLEVAGRKVPLGVTVKLARQTFQRVFDEFGQRALLAEKNRGIDWKALMHAVRVAQQAKELLSTGRVTFPRPERDLLLKIRKGALPYQEVAALIEDSVEDLEEASAKSRLPAKPDRAFADALVCKYYGAQAALG